MNNFLILKILNLEKDLSNAENFQAIEKIFLNHSESNFIQNYTQDGLLNLISNQEYNPIGLVSKVGVYFINNEKFDYSVRIYSSYSVNDTVKWMGVQQIWVVKGTGYIKIKILQLPNSINVNIFQPNE